MVWLTEKDEGGDEAERGYNAHIKDGMIDKLLLYQKIILTRLYLYSNTCMYVPWLTHKVTYFSVFVVLDHLKMVKSQYMSFTIVVIHLTVSVRFSQRTTLACTWELHAYIHRVPSFISCNFWSESWPKLNFDILYLWRRCYSISFNFTERDNNNIYRCTMFIMFYFWTFMHKNKWFYKLFLKKFVSKHQHSEVYARMSMIATRKIFL